MGKLIAEKPCSFGGRMFYIGEEVPEDLVADPVRQEKLGVLAAVPDSTGAGRRMMEEAASVLHAEGLERIPIDVGAAGEDGQRTAVQASPEEIQQAFAILQMNAEEGAKAVSGIRNENVLILIHAADSRKTVRNAAGEQADKLFPARNMPDAPGGGSGAAGTGTEGAGT